MAIVVTRILWEISHKKKLHRNQYGNSHENCRRSPIWEKKTIPSLSPPAPLPPWQLALAVAVTVARSVAEVVLVVVAVTTVAVAVASGSGSGSGRGGQWRWIGRWRG